MIFLKRVTFFIFFWKASGVMMKLDELLEKYPAAKIYFEHMPSELLERYTLRTFPPGYIIHQKDYPLNYFGIIVHGDIEL